MCCFALALITRYCLNPGLITSMCTFIAKPIKIIIIIIYTHLYITIRCRSTETFPSPPSCYSLFPLLFTALPRSFTALELFPLGLHKQIMLFKNRPPLQWENRGVSVQIAAQKALQAWASARSTQWRGFHTRGTCYCETLNESECDKNPFPGKVALFVSLFQGRNPYNKKIKNKIKYQGKCACIFLFTNSLI